MPGKTNTDLVRELTVDYAVMALRVDQFEQQIIRLDSSLGRADDSLDEARVRLAVVESQLTDLKAAHDEKDRRRWAIWLAVVGSILTLAVNIALVYLKK